jgi:hypothetical protein
VASSKRHLPPATFVSDSAFTRPSRLIPAEQILDDAAKQRDKEKQRDKGIKGLKRGGGSL